MNTIKYFGQAYINIYSNKLRSLLAVLGILVGTAAVVALLSCGQLATEKALAQLKTLGTNLLALSTYVKIKDKASYQEIPISFWRELPSLDPQILTASPYSIAYERINYQGKVIEGSIIGADGSLAQILQMKIKIGHFISFLHTYEHYCVIGNEIAQQIEKNHIGPIIGQKIHLGQEIYQIIGILAPWNESVFFNENINRAVIIPIAGISILSKDNKIANAILTLKTEANVEAIKHKIEPAILNISPKLNIFFRSAKQIIASMESQAHIFTMLLGVIGGISLLVGGIGIMNIMLVSVSERKKEIGIRKAVGAKNKDIQLLFLTESILLSLLGGILGALLGIVSAALISYFSNWSFRILMLPISAGFLVSTCTGIFFGFYPAKRAARLNPVDCLRNE